MNPDDPRHGTTRGHNAGCRCDPCCAAKLAYDKRRRLDAAKGNNRRVPAWRMTRRIQALQALGWSLRAISAEAGFDHHNLLDQRPKFVYATTFAALDAAYERLSMKLPPTQTADQRGKVARTRNHAQRKGFAPPLAWDNIDDLHEHPKRGATRTRKTDVDEAVVLRLLAGERVPATNAERHEAMRQWRARGGTERELCHMLGWKDGRYARRDGAA